MSTINYEKKYLKYKIKYHALCDTLTNSRVNDNVKNIIFTENKIKYNNLQKQVGGVIFTVYDIENNLIELDDEFTSYKSLLNHMRERYPINNMKIKVIDGNGKEKIITSPFLLNKPINDMDKIYLQPENIDMIATNMNKLGLKSGYDKKAEYENKQLDNFTKDITKDIIEYRKFFEGDINGKCIIYNENNMKQKIYEGMCKLGKKDGHGTYYYDDKSKYVGNWKNDMKEGNGIYYYDNGQIAYEGGWKEGKYSGFGKRFNKIGLLMYSGNMENGKPNGSGILFTELGKPEYDGDWKDGMKNGVGKIFNKDGKLEYEGNIKDDMINGEGKFYNTSGILYYSGNWENNKRNGKGITYYDDKSIEYDGEWKDNNLYGYGKLFIEGGILIYDGNWKDNIRCGMGKSYYDNKNIEYDGEWKDNMRNGMGIMYSRQFKNRMVWNGEWKNDIRQ